MTRTTPRRLTAAALTAVALTTAGCGGLKDPYAAETTAAGDAERPVYEGRTVAPDEPVDAPAPKQPETSVAVVAAPSSSPEQAARRFAVRFANWSWRNAAKQAQDLAALSAGELSGSYAADARTSGDVAALRTQKPSMQGTVETVTVRERRGPRARALVVTREESLSDGRLDEGGLRWNVYLAELERTRRGWSVTGWEAQP